MKYKEMLTNQIKIKIQTENTMIIHFTIYFIVQIDLICNFLLFFLKSRK